MTTISSDPFDPIQKRTFDPATGEWITPSAPTEGSEPATQAAQPSAPAPNAADPPEPNPDAPDAPAPGRRREIWNAILTIDLVILGFFALANLVGGLLLFFAPQSPTAHDVREGLGQTTTGALLWSAALTFVIAGIIPAAWVAGTRRQPWQGFLSYLGLRKPSGFGQGVFLGFACLIGVVVLAYLYLLVDVSLTHRSVEAAAKSQQSALQEGIIGALTPAAAVFLAATAAFGEEILFRGVLQRRLGVWGQAALFGAMHLEYGTVLQLVVPFGLGVLFGIVYKRTRNLWITIGAHFTFDMVQLGLALGSPRGGTGGTNSTAWIAPWIPQGLSMHALHGSLPLGLFRLLDSFRLFGLGG